MNITVESHECKSVQSIRVNITVESHRVQISIVDKVEYNGRVTSSTNQTRRVNIRTVDYKYGQFQTYSGLWLNASLNLLKH